MTDEKDERPNLVHKSERTTGDATVDGVDPGGTRPGPKASGKAGENTVEHKVSSGDRNSIPASSVTPSKDATD